MTSFVKPKIRRPNEPLNSLGLRAPTMKAICRLFVPGADMTA